ncbi:MAG: efflux RND transporter periplasmic adaptor subunit [Candidatus Paceibacterota bacterium]|jgi:RND family efflux transporter MFP subunit
MNKQTLAISAAALLIVSAIIWQIVFAKKGQDISCEEVKKTNISQEVSVSGTVKKGDEISLSFRTAGQIKNIYVSEGQGVEAGEKLAELNTSQLSLQLQSAQAQLKTAQVNLNKLVAGARAEDIQLYQTALDNAQTSYNSALQSYNDGKDLLDVTLDNLYRDYLNTLTDADLKIYNAQVFVDQSIYASDSRDVEAVRAEKDKISQAYQSEKNSLTQAKADGGSQKIDDAIVQSKSALETTRSSLTRISELWEVRSNATAAQRTSLDGHRTYISTALASVTSAQGAIASTKASNQSRNNTALAAVAAAEGQLKVAKENLNKLVAAPRQEDIDLANAQVTQAQAQVGLLRTQIDDSAIKAPVAGKIGKIGKREGEQVLSQEVVTLIPNDPFLVEVDIPEVDIGKVKLGDACRIDLDAFTSEQFSGNVIGIDSVQTDIASVVYYRTKISLSEGSEKIRTGMTANVSIVTAYKEGALSVPQRAIYEKDGKKFVKVLESDNKIRESEVQTGIKGVQGEVEIISGLKEGEKAVTFIKGE